ncbi:hypothetical protein ASPFODRAFT_370145 [Aspergillus luchuensis CBS 106.47]|uniref:Uncharacterized protein n=1 Tax=Aspergillus luchuensis (strain CBS 106.47) TaxID=1137211 RepID=A0A1M3T5I7_ASPLC|nr:hypothetical protein ASPFODRAFT_370145 [Aspergillus luchuensis CBS 106.47]
MVSLSIAFLFNIPNRLSKINFSPNKAYTGRDQPLGYLLGVFIFVAMIYFSSAVASWAYMMISLTLAIITEFPSALSFDFCRQHGVRR